MEGGDGRDDTDCSTSETAGELSIDDCPLDPAVIAEAAKPAPIGPEPLPEVRLANFAQRSERLPIPCSADCVNTCLGMVTADAVIHGDRFLSHVLPGTSQEASLRFICRMCSESLNGATTQSLIASTEDLAAVIASKSCEVPHQRSPKPANLPSAPVER